MVNSTSQDALAVGPEPIEERIDDGVEEPMLANNGSDDEELYTSNEPLLSRRPRGAAGPPKPCKQGWWKHKRSWNPFKKPSWMKQTYGLDNSTWDWASPTEKKPWRTTSIIITILLATVTAFMISTIVLAIRLKHGPRYIWLHHSNRNPESHLPYRMADDKNAYDTRYVLPTSVNLNNVYPPLQKRADPSCRRAWESLVSLSCHEKILNRSWDNGTQNLFDPEIPMYTSTICHSWCETSLHRAHALIASQCTEQDYFDTTSYTGPLSADARLEVGPHAAISTLFNRQQHMCRTTVYPTSPWSDRKEFCVDELYTAFHVVDGMYAGNLNGLATFDRMTSTSQDRIVRNWRPTVRDECDNAQYEPVGYTRPRTLGPGTGETRCGWCTLDWFERKLNGWTKGGVRGEDGEMVGLEEFIREVSRLGQRCETEDWKRIHERAVRRYKELGWLEKDWEGVSGGEEERRPAKAVLKYQGGRHGW